MPGTGKHGERRAEVRAELSFKSCPHFPHCAEQMAKCLVHCLVCAPRDPLISMARGCTCHSVLVTQQPGRASSVRRGLKLSPEVQQPRGSRHCTPHTCICSHTSLYCRIQATDPPIPNRLLRAGWKPQGGVGWGGGGQGSFHTLQEAPRVLCAHYFTRRVSGGMVQILQHVTMKTAFSQRLKTAVNIRHSLTVGSL